jgi:hypothetical protein
MRIRKSTKEIKAVGEANKNKVDPRLLVEGDVFLWENPYSAVGMEYPLITGHINIPIRLLNAVYQNQQPLVVNGEECVRLNMALWEANPQNYSNRKAPPFYIGRIQTCAKMIAGEQGLRLADIFKIGIKKRTLTEFSFLGGDNNEHGGNESS